MTTFISTPSPLAPTFSYKTIFLIIKLHIFRAVFELVMFVEMSQNFRRIGLENIFLWIQLIC